MSTLIKSAGVWTPWIPPGSALCLRTFLALPACLTSIKKTTQGAQSRGIIFYLREYVEYVVNPAGQRRVDQVTDRQRLKVRVLLDESTQLGLLVVFLVEQVEADWRDLSPSADASYLRS